MKQELAKRIAIAIEAFKSGPSARFVQIRRIPRGVIDGFHHWANGAPIEGGYLFHRRLDGQRLWLLLIEWNPSYGFYVVVFPEDQRGPIVEAHHIEEGPSRKLLKWRYAPVKRDGKNRQRREFFESLYGTTSVLIPVPTSKDEVEDFLFEVFQLAERRLLADQAR